MADRPDPEQHSPHHPRPHHPSSDHPGAEQRSSEHLSPGHPNPHPSLEDLADAAEGLLGPDRQSGVRSHLSGCGRCREAAASLQQVSSVLAAEPAPPMPDAVAARLQAALGQESARRATGRAGSQPDVSWRRPARPGAHPLTPHAHPSLGHFVPVLHRPPAHRRLVPVLAAAVLALVVGSGGYVLSATAGLNEPPVVMAAVSSADLAEQARSLEESRDLDPHRFSNAWFCARSVTRDRITGLVGARVDGSPALLVYSRSGAESVTVVTGCSGLQPTAIASAVLDR